jgi:4-nitrophenyl phosphatase
MYRIPTNIRSLILDMDGVLWKGDEPIGDLPAIFERIRARGLQVAFVTNNGTRTPDQYVGRLARFGVKIEAWQVLTSSLAVANLLGERLPSGGPVFAIGEMGLLTALREKGFEPLAPEKADTARAVVMAVDRQINFEKMCKAALLVGRGLPFYASNPDKSFPTPCGRVPGAGAWISVVVTTTGVEPVYAGKPSPTLVEMACRRLGSTKRETLVVGDRLETDIAAGQAAGCPVAQVLSGVSSRKEGQAWKPSIATVADDLAALLR